MKLLTELKTGECFLMQNEPWMKLDPRVAEALERRGTIPKATYARDLDNYPITAVHLDSLNQDRFTGKAEGELIQLSGLAQTPLANATRVLSALREGIVFGLLPGSGNSELLETPEQRFYEDRVRKVREVELEIQRLAATVTVTPVSKPMPVKTKGDQAVENARAGSLKQIDDAVNTIEGSGQLLRKIGVDEEVTKAIESGIKAFAPYRKLRRQGKG